MAKFTWKRPEGLTKYSPLPQERYNVDDPERDVHSPAERAVFRYLSGAVPRSTDGNRIEPQLVTASYGGIAKRTGFSVSTVQRAIYGLIRKETIAPWGKGAELASNRKTATGRSRGEGGHRATTYHVRRYKEEVLPARAANREFATFSDPKTGKPHWLTIGVGRRILSPVECGGPPKGWNAAEYIAWKAERMDRREERAENRAAREIGAPPAAAEAPEITEEVKRSEPPKPIRDAVRLHCAASYGGIWEMIDMARAAAAELKWGISDDDIALVVQAAARRVNRGEIRNCKFFTITVPDLIRSNPEWAPQPAIAQVETTQQRIHRLAQAIEMRDCADFPQMQQEALATLQASDPGEVELARELVDSERRERYERRIEQLIEEIRVTKSQQADAKEQTAAVYRLKIADPKERDEAVARYQASRGTRSATG